MADETWAPAPRHGGAAPEWSATPLGAIPGARTSEDDLEDIFAGDAGLPGTIGWGGPTPAAPVQDDDSGLGDLFDTDVPAEASPAPSTDDTDLSDLFVAEAPPAPAGPVQDDDSGLGDLFDTDVAAEASPAPSTDEAADDSLEGLFDSDTVADAPETIEAAAPVVEAPADVWGSIPLPEPTPAAAEEAPAEETAAQETVEEVEEAFSLTSLVAAAPAAATPLPEAARPTESGTEAPETTTESAPETPAVETPAPAAQEEAQEEAPKRTRFDLAGRRKAVEEASLGVEEALRSREHVDMLERYVVPAHVWGYVDRLLGYVSATPHVQAVVNPFVLTRDRLLDAEQRRKLEEVLAPSLMEASVMIQNPRDAKPTFDLAYDELIGISVLGPLWRDPEVTEIMVDGWNRIVIERNGNLLDTPLSFRDAAHAARVARDLASKLSDRGLTPANPLVTAQLPGARVTFAYGSVVKSGLSISLRKFVDLLGMEKLLDYGALTPEMAELLHQLVVARANVLVSGGTGTGKTTQINALSQYIPDNERVITIEDAFELQLSNSKVVALQTKEKASADDEVIVTQEMLLVNTLRMRPDRVVVGEIREGKGAVVMLQAANTGHDGTMTTIHAQSPSVALNERLADLVMEVTSSPSEVVRRSVASALDVVVQVTRKHGRRYISEIAIVDRSCVKDGSIVPEPVFVGDVDSAGETTFQHVGAVRRDTAIGMKLAETGFDLAQWEPRR